MQVDHNHRILRRNEGFKKSAPRNRQVQKGVRRATSTHNIAKIITVVGHNNYYRTSTQRNCKRFSSYNLSRVTIQRPISQNFYTFRRSSGFFNLINAPTRAKFFPYVKFSLYSYVVLFAFIFFSSAMVRVFGGLCRGRVIRLMYFCWSTNVHMF